MCLEKGKRRLICTCTHPLSAHETDKGRCALCKECPSFTLAQVTLAQASEELFELVKKAPEYPDW